MNKSGSLQGECSQQPAAQPPVMPGQMGQQPVQPSHPEPPATSLTQFPQPSNPQSTITPQTAQHTSNPSNTAQAGATPPATPLQAPNMPPQSMQAAQPVVQNPAPQVVFPSYVTVQVRHAVLPCTSTYSSLRFVPQKPCEASPDSASDAMPFDVALVNSCCTATPAAYMRVLMHALCIPQACVFFECLLLTFSFFPCACTGQAVHTAARAQV